MEFLMFRIRLFAMNVPSVNEFLWLDKKTQATESL